MPLISKSPNPYSTQFVWCLLNIEDSPSLLSFDAIIFQHPTINSRILALEPQLRLGCDSFKNEMVIAVGAVFIRFLEFFGIFAEGFLALFAGEGLLFISE
jgi:hypothetical protein